VEQTLDSGAGRPEVKFCVLHMSTEQNCDFTVWHQNCAHETNKETQSTDLTDFQDVIESRSVNVCRVDLIQSPDVQGKSGEPTLGEPVITNRVD